MSFKETLAKLGNIYYIFGGVMSVLVGIFGLLVEEYLWGVIAIAVGAFLIYRNYKQMKARSQMQGPPAQPPAQS